MNSNEQRILNNIMNGHIENEQIVNLVTNTLNMTIALANEDRNKAINELIYGKVLESLCDNLINVSSSMNGIDNDLTDLQQEIESH
ncbi:hypothetical protein D1B17_03780 [Companilactobacillus zhachilii]|uniref:Uncharacterized protein n=1 Tax=Companilactobacillus zhachilii TaxID=2304606 RepID=A0A386PRJ7_9LACO|nr:hypothetical protein [Companilactobacillus zhachilii]AYE37798.1 hypothetical protein D1B17_03780 [Companilactobacillus zhachilii]